MESSRKQHHKLITKSKLMKLPLLLLLLISALNANCQNFKEKKLKTEINEVTVFLSGAQIFESGTATIPVGKTIFKIENLSPFLDDKSIRVKAEGDFTILSVNHKYNYLNTLKKSAKLDSLRQIMEDIDQDILRNYARLEVLKEKQNLLSANRHLGGESAGASMAQLKQAMDFYEAEVSKMKEEEIKIKKIIEDSEEKKKKIELQRKELNDQRDLPGSEIEIRINSEVQTNTKFQVTYLVSNAGWFPKYDVRVENIKSPLELTYKAEVFQSTGIDWKNVKLRFSNGNPNQTGVAPELAAWNLSYARLTRFERNVHGQPMNAVNTVKGIVMDSNGMPIPGASVVIKGTTIGTATDSNGRYHLTLPNDASQLTFSFIGYTTQEIPVSNAEMNVTLQEDIATLQEVVTVGHGGGSLQGKAAGVQIRGASSIYGSRSAKNLIGTTVVENQTTVEIEVEMPYTIMSDGEKLVVDLRRHEVDAHYEYYAVPKLDKDAFLVARIINWDQYNLLEGEANLYFEDAFVGRSILDAKALKDTLTISLGRDKNIVIGRTKNDEFSKIRTIGSNRVETRGFKIIARNKKSLDIKLTIFDQVPVSVISDITVTPAEISGGQLDAKTGKIVWQIDLKAQSQKDLLLEYEVKYPKREVVVLE